MADQPAPEGGPKPAPVVIKKYANRRLYNTATSAYVTLDHLSTDGEGEDRLRGLRRQDRRGHHASGADPDHLRGGEQGRPDAAADPLPAPAHLVLRRQPAGRGAAVSRDVDERSSRATRTRCAATCRMRSASTRSSSSKRWASRTWRCSRTPCACSTRSAPARPAPGAGRRRRRPTAASRPSPRRRPGRRNDEAIEDLKRKLDELQNQLAELSKKP